jgi:exonuclease III
VVRIIGWNIRAGGGVRAEAIVRQLVQWQPDVVALSEFRATAPSQAIACALAAAGLCHQRTTVDRDQPAINALLVASRWPLRRVSLRTAPDNPHRWLHVNVAARTPFALMAMHIPNRTTGMKYPFMNSIVELIDQWRGPQALIIGDTNSGRIEIDEESPAFNRTEDSWLRTLDERGWRDGFRWLHGDTRQYTWYSPNGRNGFRLDQAFIHPRLTPRLQSLQHCWGGYNGSGRFDALSDHAALLVDFSSG